MLKNAVFKPLFGIHGKRNRQPVFVFLVTGGRHGRSKEERFMPEFWEFVKSVWIPEDSDQYWKEVYDKAQELYQKYPVDFVKRQILGFCEYLDQKWQDERDKAGTEEEQ